MSETLDAQEIWRLFRETDRKFAETDRKFAETDRKFAETDRKFAETDRKFAETDRKFAETGAYIKQISQQSDKESAETREFIKQLGRKWDREWGRFSNRLGEFVESMVAPKAAELFQQRGIQVHEVHHDVSASRERVAMEIDLLVVNDHELVAIEVKSKLSVDDVKEHAERLKRFHLAFPHYKGIQVYGAMAGMVIPDEAARFAYRQGMFVLGQSGETMAILNDENFRPRAWGEAE